MAYDSSPNTITLSGLAAELLVPPLSFAYGIDEGTRFITKDAGPTLEYALVIIAGVPSWKLLSSGGGGGGSVDVKRARYGTIGPLAFPFTGLTNANVDAPGGGTVLVGDRIGVVAQGGSSIADVGNGIWIASAGAWTRAADFDSSTEAVVGTLLVIEEGAVVGRGLSGALFEMVTPGTVTPGATAMAFKEIAGEFSVLHFTVAGPYSIPGSAAVPGAVTTITFNHAGGPFPVDVANLPSLVGVVNGAAFRFVNFNDSGATIALTPSGVQTINGTAGAFVLARSTTLIADTVALNWIRLG